MSEYEVNIRWEQNKFYRTRLPYLPRKGDVLEIYDDSDEEKELAKGEVIKVVYFENRDTRNGSEPRFDVYIKTI